MKLRLQRQLWLFFLLIVITITSQAQVTIGSAETPMAGALLDLKMENLTTKGLALPRVDLKDLKTLTMGDNVIADGPTQSGASTVWKDHTGLLVYNMGGNVLCGGIAGGLYVWDGSEWQSLLGEDPGEQIPPGSYADDLAALQELNSSNPGNSLSWTGDPSTWRGVTWEVDACGERRVTGLSINGKGLTTVAALENLSALTYLNINGNQIATLDVSKNTELTNLSCGDNQFTTLDVSKNTKLTGLYLDTNNLSVLDVSKNTKLTYLNCNNNSLTSLDVTKNTELTDLRCDSNPLTILDVSKNTKLTRLDCRYNTALTTLNITNNTELAYLDCYCSGGQLKSLDVSKSTKLTYLNFNYHSLGTIDVTKNTELLELYCLQTQLTTLDISKNTKLTRLECQSNALSTLNVANNTELTRLHCFANSLTTLDITKNAKLTVFACDRNLMQQAALNTIRNAASANGLCTSFNSANYKLTPQGPTGYVVTKPTCP